MNSNNFQINTGKKFVLGTEYITNMKKTSQAAIETLQMMHFPDTPLESSILIGVLKSHLHTLAVFGEYLKLQNEKELLQNTLLNNMRTNIHIC
jgi:hypothetical protein